MYPGVYARTQPGKAAVIRPAAGEVRTYRELDARSNQLAHFLFEQGLRRGDRVALFMENNLVFFDVIWACMRSGLYITPINRYLSASEAAYIVGDCDARALVASAALEQSAALGALFASSAVKLAVGGRIEGFADYEQATGGQSTMKLAEEHIGTMMLYSSGTTGRPKGIVRALPVQSPELGSPQLEFVQHLFGFDTATVYLSPAPMYHGAPIGYATAAIQAGATVIMLDKFEAEPALQAIERYRVTHSQWVPAMFIRMLKLDPEIRDKYDLSSHRYAIHAAAPCPVEVKQQMIAWWGPILEEYYSSSENAGYATIGSEDWLAHPGSVGRARGLPFHICDDAGTELPPDVPGLIYAEAPPGPGFVYHKDPGKTASARHPDHPNWITVGDVGYLDAAGYLYLTDRRAFMIISGGVNIYPQQIEDVLALHPKLADVAVIGVPNEDLGEEVKAVVELAPGIAPSDALAQEILDFVRGRLGRQLTPRSVDFVAVLPRLPTGKLYKKALRDQYWPKKASFADTPARV